MLRVTFAAWLQHLPLLHDTHGGSGCTRTQPATQATATSTNKFSRRAKPAANTHRHLCMDRHWTWKDSALLWDSDLLSLNLTQCECSTSPCHPGCVSLVAKWMNYGYAMYVHKWRRNLAINKCIHNCTQGRSASLRWCHHFFNAAEFFRTVQMVGQLVQSCYRSICV